MSSQGASIRNRNKKRGKGLQPGADPMAPTKEEKQIAKHLRFNLKTKEGICMGSEMAYFVGCKAVDMLMASQWASAASKKDETVLFPNRQACCDFLQILLEKDLFRRVYRIRRKKPKSADSDKKRDKKKEKKIKDEAECDDKDKDGEKTKEEEDQKDEKKQKKPRKPAKLQPHEEQIFVDGSEADEALYVWVYDPVSTKGYLIGTAVIVGAIAACLYPLWPMQLRLGVYYVCLGLIGLLGLLIVLAAVRAILFCGMWVATAGKKHFWLYPNLFEDVGFFDSFKPTYSLTTPSEKKAKKHGKADKEKDKDRQSSEEDKEDKEATPKQVTPDETEPENDTEPRPAKTNGEASCGDESDASKFEMLHHSDFKASDKASDDDDEEEDDSDNCDDEPEQ